MKRFVSVIAALGGLILASPACAAGLSFIEVPAKDGPPIVGAVWSPCALPAGNVTIGDRSLPGVKETVSLRIDRDVLDYFQEGGPGWQDRINAALRKAAGQE